MNEDAPILPQFPKVQKLPSGLVVELGEWTVKELSSITSGKSKKETQLSKLLKTCKIVDDPNGVYGFKDGSQVEGDRLLIGDKTVLLILQRILSHSHNFEFDFRCEHCGEKASWTIDLRRILLAEVPDILDDSEMDEYNTSHDDSKIEKTEDGYALVWPERFGNEPIELGDDIAPYLTTLPQDSASTFSDNNKFPFHIPSLGLDGEFKLMTGKDEIRIERERKKKGKGSMAALFHRVVSIDGMDARRREKAITDFTSRDLDSLFLAIASVDCGVESEVEIECPECGESNLIELPLMDRGFFSPALRRKRSSRRSISR